MRPGIAFVRLFIIRGRLRAVVLRSLVLLLICTSGLVQAGCRRGSTSDPQIRLATGGEAERGERVIQAVGCGGCHTIPGVRGARGRVGPPLDFFGDRSFIAGRLPNSPENLIRWVRDPRSIDPLTAMPDVGLSEQQARDVAAYLYTLH